MTAVPVAVTDKVFVTPTHALPLPGCAVITGAAFTVTVAVAGGDGHVPFVTLAEYVVVVAGEAYTVVWYVPATYGEVNPASLNNPVTGVHIAVGGTPPTGVIFTDQDVRVPKSPDAPSLIAKVQLPLGVEKRSENKVTFDTNPVGPCVRAASGR